VDNLGEHPEESPKQTTKARLLEAQGKDVPLDLFLFSCFEYEQLLKATGRLGGSGFNTREQKQI
jgi:hypothetical protein